MNRAPLTLNWPWRQIWKTKIPLKVACFTWLLAKEAVLTYENLRKRNNILVTHCCLCGEAAETARHLFLHCKITDQLWKIFINLRGIQWTMPSKIVDTLSSWEEAGIEAKNISYWRTIPACIWFNEALDGVVLTYEPKFSSNLAKILPGIHPYFGVGFEAKLLNAIRSVIFQDFPFWKGEVVKVGLQSIHIIVLGLSSAVIADEDIQEDFKYKIKHGKEVFVSISHKNHRIKIGTTLRQLEHGCLKELLPDLYNITTSPNASLSTVKGQEGVDQMERHIRFNEHYDFTDRIMDLNFYGYIIDKFKIMSEETTTAGGRTLKQLLAEFVWQDDAFDYVRGKRPYPGGMDWIGAKRILAVMNSGKKHFDS
ncbi:hypothetical protein MTR67_034642 [Solanum verrucosum]|uniref:Reverse transcriptase zinc-binding domain-containing protein n=1 Tax=Solanum verrucosum TaxID=315347 RepID=A0AAF0U8G7_SOLVR|nr:hypothetical protein MTR67_034642 [Solanum verrucosum]